MKTEKLVRKAKTLLEKNGDMEAVLRHLRHRGCSKTEAIKVVKALNDTSLTEAKQTVHFSEAWRNRRVSDDQFHDTLTHSVEGEAESS